MSCDCDKPKIYFKKGCEVPSPVLEIKNEECPILFHTVEVEGTVDEHPPYIGQYRNILLVYKGDGATLLFNSDGIPSAIANTISSVNGKMGTVVLTTSDLENTSDYQNGTQVSEAIAAAVATKQDTLTAGENIQINGNVISATDTTYTAGENIQINNGVISSTGGNYTAGNGLILSGTEFSADTAVLATRSYVDDLVGDIASTLAAINGGA